MEKLEFLTFIILISFIILNIFTLLRFQYFFNSLKTRYFNNLEEHYKNIEENFIQSKRMKDLYDNIIRLRNEDLRNEYIKSINKYKYQKSVNNYNQTVSDKHLQTVLASIRSPIIVILSDLIEGERLRESDIMRGIITYEIIDRVKEQA